MPLKLLCMNRVNFYNNENDNDGIERRNLRFFTDSSLWCELYTSCMLKWPGRNCVQTTCNALGAHHVQLVMCHVVRRDSSAIKFDRVEITFIFALFCCLK